MSEPREWWIQLDPIWPYIHDGDADDDDLGRSYDSNGRALIKVIEYSAYEKLQSENEKLRAEVEKLEDDLYLMGDDFLGDK